MEIKVCIIGAGPAGLMASIYSAAAGANTLVVETNTVAGRKLLLTGGGRCNFTHQAEPRELVRAFGLKGRFLSYCLHEFPPDKVRWFFQERGLESTVDETGCVFPVTQRASDVRDVLVREAGKAGVRFLYDRRVEKVEKAADAFTLLTNRGETMRAGKLIIATGGLSWPKTGSTGAGYRFARELGHRVIEPRASLVPLVTAERWPAELAGAAIENVKLSASVKGRKVAASGPMVFAGDGIGGPAVLDLSRFLTDYLPNEKEPIAVSVDMIVGMDATIFERHLLSEVAANSNKAIANVLSAFVPKRVAEVLCEQAGCDANLLANQVSRDMRRKLIKFLKAVPLSIVRTRPIEEATVTHGGVDTKEIDPKTMKSKICPGLFFAGEILDVDGPCGGYNLQICWSTAALTGSQAGRAVITNTLTGC